MHSVDTYQWILVAAGSLLMAGVLLNVIGGSAVSEAWVSVSNRRKLEQRRKLENAAAEAAGRAAALEPLALNPDGSIEEPILAKVEGT